MTLKEIRKKYIGLQVVMDLLDSDFTVVEEGDDIVLEWRSGDEYVYEATILLDTDYRIKKISRMTGKCLIGDEATHVNYRPMRVAVDEYDLLDTSILSIVEENNAEGHKKRKLTLGDVIDCWASERVIYLFGAGGMLGAIGSKRIGMISNEERNITVTRTSICLDILPFTIYAYLAEDEIPEKWK